MHCKDFNTYRQQKHYLADECRTLTLPRKYLGDVTCNMKLLHVTTLLQYNYFVYIGIIERAPI